MIGTTTLNVEGKQWGVRREECGRLGGAGRVGKQLFCENLIDDAAQ